jgi:hypothetical protein
MIYLNLRIVTISVHHFPCDSNRDQAIGIDSTGFTYVHHRSQHLPKFIDGADGVGKLLEPSSMEQYLEETMDLVKDILRADTVLVQDWRVRSFSAC